MKAATLKALRASIAHWKRMRKNRDSTQEDPSAEHCALCSRFDVYFCKLDGEWCPVAGPEGEREGCRGTPWANASEAFGNSDVKTWRVKATAEIQFLESLLPRKKAVKAKR